MQPRLLTKTSFAASPSLAFLLPQQLGLKSRAYAVARPLYHANLLNPLLVSGQNGRPVLRAPALKPCWLKADMWRAVGALALTGTLLLNLGYGVLKVVCFVLSYSLLSSHLAAQ